jgi:amino acid transporter
MDDITKTPDPFGKSQRETAITLSPSSTSLPVEPAGSGDLQRHFGLLHATALNISMIVGAGVFLTIPYMLLQLPGPYALLGWLVAGVLIVLDGMIWSELGAMMPGSGGTYLYLLEAYGPKRLGRLAAFLFIWQFLLSGPLEIGSGLIAIAVFSNGLDPNWKAFNTAWTRRCVLVEQWDLAVTVEPGRLAALLIGVVIIFLLYRRITTLGKWTIAVSVGVLGVIVWILIEGAMRFNPQTAFDFTGSAAEPPANLATNLGGAMILAIYSYLGWYQVCYIGDEVRDPGRTIPRSILLSAGLVCVLFVALHLAMLGTVSWHAVPADEKALDDYNLPATFMAAIHGPWAPALVSLLLIWSCFASAFAGLLGYSRIPYGAARYGHFFAVLGKIHPTRRIPHVALLFVGGLMLIWVFFDVDKVIKALVVTRILEQFIAQIIGVMVLRRTHPKWPRPYRIWLYPLPCLAALIGWGYLYCSAEWLFIVIGLVTLQAGVIAFLIWSRQAEQWPFKPAEE